MFWGKKKSVRTAGEIEKEIVQSCVAQIHGSFLDMNEKVTLAFGSINKIQKTIEANSANVSSLSQAITTLAQYYSDLDRRLKTIEDKLALTGVSFTKKSTN